MTLCLPLCFVVVLPPLAVESGFYSRFADWDRGQEQAERCKAHAERLKALRGLHGYQNGSWDRAIEQTEWNRRYWELMWAIRESPTGRPTERMLQQLLEYIGPDRYRRGWSPPLLPEDVAFDPSPRMPPAANPAGS